MRHHAQIGTRQRWVGVSAALILLSGAPGVGPSGSVGKAHAFGVLTATRADSCDSVFTKSRVGWATREYKGALRAYDSDAAFPETHLMLTLNELAVRMEFDGPLDFGALGDDPPTAEIEVPVVGSIATFGAHGLYGFQYAPTGRLLRPRILVSSLSRRLDSAVVRAVTVASDSGGLLPLPEGSKDSVELRLTIGTSPMTDSLTVAGPLFRVRLPVFDQVTRPWSDNKSEFPRYPVGERQAGIEGKVHVELVIRSDGTADPQSILIQRATTMSFAQNVYEAILKAKFVPARVAGCPVPSLVTQPFEFTIAR
ncbi:MAG TPA: TonB family protein [Gemmatimonadaceae bacterium]